MKTPVLRLTQRLCLTCGNKTISAVYCCKCYGSSPAGKEEKRQAWHRQKYKPLEDGGVCQQCVHWHHRCTLGIPEAGTVMAELCSAREFDSVLE